MKTKFTLLFLSAFAFFGLNAQQIPNGSFDTWTSPLNPDGWTTYESLFGQQVGLAQADSADKVDGPVSLKLANDTVAGFPQYGVLSGLASLGTGAVSQNGLSFTGVPFPYRPDTLYFAYKYTSPGLDTAGLSIELSKSGTDLLAGGIPLETSAQWALVYVPLVDYYSGGTTPDTLLIQFFSSFLDSPVIGSVFHVDAVTFGYQQLPNGLQEIADKMNFNLYPNPASNYVNISASEDASNFHVIIADLSGRFVANTNLTGENTNINTSNYASGTYIYRIADKTGNILKQDRFSVVK